MHVFSHRSTILVGFMMVLILVITGCGDGDNENATISGQADFPPNPNLGGSSVTNAQTNLGGSSVTNAQFIVIDFEKRDPNNANGTGFQTIANGKTDSSGKFEVTTPRTRSAAVIVTSTVPLEAGGATGPGLIAGLVNLDQDTVSKNFAGATTIACFAGLFAVSDGSITAQQLNAQRISILEQAAAGLVASTDFLNQDSIVASGNAVRQRTDNGAHL